MIYKDECAKSFDNPMSEGGINVSLKDFVGFSEMYSKINFKQKGHPIYLNIKKIPRKDKELTKVTKVAIGKPERDAPSHEMRPHDPFPATPLRMVCLISSSHLTSVNKTPLS